MNEKILIVGGSSGLGRKLAELYAAEGAQVGVIGRRANLLEDLRATDPQHIQVLAADINETGIEVKLKSLVDKMNGMDTLILAASVVELNIKLSLQPELKTIDTNVQGFTRVLNFAWHYFNEQHGGHIVVVTSVAAARGAKDAPAYNASKAFQSSYVEGLRLKALRHNKKIKVTELVPGYIDTDMAKGNRIFWMASVEKAAKQSRKAIHRKKRRAFITKRWWLVYHLQRMMPAFISDPLLNGSWKLKSRK